jgi:hypothetical protein
MITAASLPRLRLERARSLPLSALIMPACMHCKGDVMAYDADSLVELLRDARARQKQAAAIRPAHELIIPKIEMLVGAWHVDEYGNQAREIRARD